MGLHHMVSRASFPVARIGGLERRDIGFAGLGRIDEVNPVTDEAWPC